jgi:hypothetical protein
LDEWSFNSLLFSTISGWAILMKQLNSRGAQNLGSTTMTLKPGLGSFLVLLVVTTAGVVAQQPVSESEPVTVTATVAAIDKATRVVTLKGPQGTREVKAPPEMEGFNSLRVGDQVTATYFEAVAINVRRPGQPAPSAKPETTVTRKDRTPGSEVRRQQTFTVTIDAVDLKAPASVRVRDAKGRVLSLPVIDPKQIQNLKTGETVDITYYESLLVKVERKK